MSNQQESEVRSLCLFESNKPIHADLKKAYYNWEGRSKGIF